MAASRPATEDRLIEHRDVHTPTSSLEFRRDHRPQHRSQALERRSHAAREERRRIVLGLTLAVSLALVGVVFFALAIAFPAVLAVAPSFPTLISASDIALATQLAAVWPVFVVASIAFFVASLAVIVKLVQRVDPSPAA